MRSSLGCLGFGSGLMDDLCLGRTAAFIAVHVCARTFLEQVGGTEGPV